MTDAFPRFRVPHVFVLLTGVILACSLLTYVVPSGEYERRQVEIEGHPRTVVVPGTFTPQPKHLSAEALLAGQEVEGRATPVGLLQFLTAIPRGMAESADIIFLIFILGGVFGILQASGALTGGVHALLDRYGASGPGVTIALMLVLAAGASTLGMGEEFIPLVPVFLLVSRELGYDRIYGLAIVLLAYTVGFAAATTNPFTVSVAQGIAELPLNSGMALRLAFFVVCMAVTLRYVLRYGARVRRDRSASLMPDDPFELDLTGAPERGPFTGRHRAILLVGAAIFAFIVYAVQGFGWWMAEMSGGFLLIGIAAAAIARMRLDDAARAFVRGAEEMVVAALVVGFARGIQVVLTDGEILDTLIHAAAGVLGRVPDVLAAQGMFLFQLGLNFFIPSGSGQAAVTMPLMAPLADVVGLTRQTAVLAFTAGDGLSNMLIPTSGILMAMLGIAKVPYDRWVRFVVPVFLQLVAVAAVFLGVAVVVGYR
jgi:uncharacterized ion transporter superfamily protein YfcC